MSYHFEFNSRKVRNTVWKYFETPKSTVVLLHVVLWRSVNENGAALDCLTLGTVDSETHYKHNYKDKRFDKSPAL